MIAQLKGKTALISHLIVVHFDSIEYFLFQSTRYHQ